MKASSFTLTKNSLLEKQQEDVITHFSSIPSFAFRFEYAMDKSQLLLHTKLLMKSALNPRDSDINFLIILKPTFPYSEPIVLCKSNFTTPSLFDNRNLGSALVEKWAQQNSSSRLIAIISNLPAFVAKVERDITKNGLLCYEGSYNFGYSYNVNDFVANPSVFLFRIDAPYSQINSHKQILLKSYLVITDLYLILISPDEAMMNRGKIVYQGELIMIVDVLPHPEAVLDKVTGKMTETVEGDNAKEGMGMVIKWKEGYQKKLTKKLVVKKSDYVRLFNVINDKRQLLVKTFAYTLTNSSKTVEELKSIIEIREKEATAENSFYAVQELMELYQQIIEQSSEDDKENCSKYVEKLQVLVKAINHHS